MADAKVESVGPAIAGTSNKTQTRSFTWKFWVLVITIVVVAISPLIPCLWGWKMGWLGTGFGDWSMAAHGGIMPGSIVYHQKLPQYSVGDIVSFEYNGNDDPTQNGPSLKLVVAKNSDGSYCVKGMNYVNSFAPCDVSPRDIYGKVVWHHSYLPESYWRWLTMGWTLNYDEIDARWHAIFSFQTIRNIFNKAGWFRNWIEFNYAKSDVSWDAKRSSALILTANELRFATPQAPQGAMATWSPDKGDRILVNNKSFILPQSCRLIVWAPQGSWGIYPDEEGKMYKIDLVAHRLNPRVQPLGISGGRAVISPQGRIAYLNTGRLMVYQKGRSVDVLRTMKLNRMVLPWINPMAWDGETLVFKAWKLGAQGSSRTYRYRTSRKRP